MTLGVGPGWPQLFVVVADDRPDAAKLRSELARALGDADIPNSQIDPAAFHPIDRNVLVAHPSASGAATLTSEIEMPELHWKSNQNTETERAAWLEAVGRAFEAGQPATGPFTALAAYQSAASLALGARAPATDGEAAFVAALPAERDTYVVAGLAHEDESDGDAASYAVLGDRTVVGFAFLPWREGLPASADCDPFGGATSDRYEEWVAAQHLYMVGYWPCSDDSFLRPFGDGDVEDCLSWSPRIDEDGVAACTATAHVTVDSTCDAAYGWLDPLGPGGKRAPRVEHDSLYNYDYRVCDLPQLTGRALASCVHDLDCPDCEPGWCATEVPELLSDCSTTTHPDPFRFVLGSNTVAQGAVIVRCETAESP